MLRGGGSLTRSIALLAWVVVLVSGCAGAPSGARLSDGPTVELVVRNERLSAISAYVEWQGARPIRLGEVPAGSTVTFLPSFRADELRVVFGALGSTAGGSTDPFVPVRRGDRMEWVALPRGTFYRRLES